MPLRPSNAIRNAALFSIGLALALGACSRKLKSGTAELAEEEADGLATAAPQGGWCGHLGSARDGRSTETLGNADWTEREPERLWKAEVGVGAAGVVAHGGKLFAVGNANDKDTVVCLDAMSGDQQWAISYPCELDRRQFEGGPAAAPTLDPANGRLFVLSHEGELRCLAVADGAELWRKNLIDDFGGRRPRWGYAGAPLLADSLVVVEPGGDGSSVVGLDAATGGERWRAGSDKAAYGAAIVFPRDGRSGVAVFNAFGLVGHDLENGGELFRHKWETSYDVNAATPCYHRGHIFICSGYGTGGGLISIKGDAPELVYETRDAVAQFQSPVRVGEHLFLVSGDNNRKSRLVCLSFVDGSQAWSEAVGGNRGNVIAVGGHLIAITERGEAILCEASAEEFVERGRFQAARPNVWAPPAFADGVLYVRNNDGQLQAWDLR